MPVKSSASFRMTALPMLLTAQLLAAAVLALTLVWVLHFRGGVSWKPTSKSLFVYTVIIHPSVIGCYANQVSSNTVCVVRILLFGIASHEKMNVSTY